MDQHIAQDFVYEIVTSPQFAADRTSFAACLSGLYRSTDGGAHWQQVIENVPVTAAAVSPAFAQDRTLFAGIHGAVMRSTDGGASWQQVALALPAPVITALAVSPTFADDGRVFAATLEDGVFCSEDSGARWHDWNFGLIGFNIQALAVSPAFARDNTLFAGNEIGLFASTNAGRSWSAVRAVSGGVSALAMSPQFAADQMTAVGTESSGVWCVNLASGAAEITGLSALEDEISALILDHRYPARRRLLVLHDDHLMFTKDAGRHWSRLEPDERAEVVAVAAPLGLDDGAPLLLGLADGRMIPHALHVPAP